MDISHRPSKYHRFSDEQRWLLLLEHDKCLDHGARAAFYRAVGVSAGAVRKWMDARSEGRLTAPDSLAPDVERESGGQRSRWMNTRERLELERLRRENAALEKRVQQSEAAVEILGKASALLDSMARSAASQEPEKEPEPEPGMPEWLRRHPRRHKDSRTP